MKVYVCNKGVKTLFHEGAITSQEWRKIIEEVKWYFGWKEISIFRTNDEICLMDGQKIERIRKEAFKREGVVA